MLRPDPYGRPDYNPEEADAYEPIESPGWSTGRNRVPFPGEMHIVAAESRQGRLEWIVHPHFGQWCCDHGIAVDGTLYPCRKLDEFPSGAWIIGVMVGGPGDHGFVDVTPT